ncbi:MAG: penicillin-binding protein activator [bacterium]
MQAITRPLFLSLLTALVLILGGCGSRPEKPETPTAASDPLHGLATQAAADENHAIAAQHYLTLAGRTQGDISNHYRLMAADQLLLDNNADEAERLIGAVDETLLGNNDAFRLRVIRAELALRKNLYSDALETLQFPAPDAAGRLLLQRFYTARALAYRLAGDSAQQLQALLALDPTFEDPDKKLANQIDILRTLRLTGPLPESEPGISGWNSLAEIVVLPEDSYYPRYLEWRGLNPLHPAMDELVLTYKEMQARSQVHTDRIAVLLPTQGKYATAASAIRDGLVANWYQTLPAQRPQLSFYDTSDSNQIWPIYQQAIDEGAQVIVGPLQKEAVAQLARAGELDIPVLALNQIQLDATPPENLFQYALLPEDEAAQIALRGMELGEYNALVLYPNNDWGERIHKAFESELEFLGGKLVTAQAYDPAGPDYSGAIKQALLLDDSAARHAEIQRILGKKLEFTPRRRADIDYIFLIAKQRQARQIRPQLQFFFAGDLPVRSTSQAWSGTLTREQTPDVSGIQLPDIPWLLVNDLDDPLSRNQFAELFPRSKSSLGRLYAMGMDAYTMLPVLRRMQFSELDTIDGRTGLLYMDSSQQVHRLLVWAELGERPRILGYSNRPPSSPLLIQQPNETLLPIPMGEFPTPTPLSNPGQ